MTTKRPIHGLAVLCVLLIASIGSSGTGESGTAATNDRVAIILAHTTDADDTKWNMNNLHAHFSGVIRSFWDEVSHGAYAPEFVFFDLALPVTTEQLRSYGFGYPIDRMIEAVPDLPVPAYVPTEYSMSIFLLSGAGVGYAGGMGDKALRVNGVDYPTASVGSFTYNHDPDAYLGFYSTPPGEAFGGIQSGTMTRYPEMGLLDEDGTLLHEWGHGLGLTFHANGWYADSNGLEGNIYYQNKRESMWNQAGGYGNWFDTMGRGEYSLHFNAYFQDLLGWLKPEERQDIDATTRSVHLAPLESNPHGNKRAAYIPVAPGDLQRPSPFANSMNYAFYVEYRQPIGFDRHLAHPDLVANTEGLMVTLTRQSSPGAHVASWLVNMGPHAMYATPDTVINSDTHVIESGDVRLSFQHATLNKGMTFYDEETKVLLTNVQANGEAGVTFDAIRDPVPGAPSGIHQTLLQDGERLEAGDRIYSPELTHWAILQPEDGNFVVYTTEQNWFRWGTYNHCLVPLWPGPQHLEVVDGNVRLVREGLAVWETATGGNPGAALKADESGNLLVISASGDTLWSSADGTCSQTIELSVGSGGSRGSGETGGSQPH